MSGTPIYGVIKKEHERDREAETMYWPTSDEELAVRTVILVGNGSGRCEKV
jgi:hypothetical protein